MALICAFLNSAIAWQQAKATVYWDCNGMGCDSMRVPNEWGGGGNPYYLAREFYAPYRVPEADRSEAGELFWGTFAASDNFAALLGENSPDFAE